MLQVHQLTITHQKDLQTIIANLSLVINTGDKLAIIGDEGTGKSTLLQALVAPNLVENDIQVKGQITNRFNRVGYLPQYLNEDSLKLTVNDFLYGTIDYTSFDFQLFWTYAQAFSLPIEQFEDKGQTLASLSGGEKIKLQLLKLLAHDPDLLILDEPSGDLDMDSLAWLENFIRTTDKTVIFISHDETLLSQTATSILHLELLRKRKEPQWTYFKGDYATYKQERRERFAKQLQVAKKERSDQQKRLTENHRIQQQVQQQLRQTKNSSAGRLLAKKMRALKAQEGRFEREAAHFTAIPYDMEHISLFFSDSLPLPARKVILHWEKEALTTGQVIDLTIKGQDRIALTGSNGVGKTQLLRKIYQELGKRADLSVGYLPQDYQDLLPPDQSALDFLTPSSSTEEARTLLASLQFTREEIHHPALALSGGQKAKLFLAKMVLEKANVLILDEPTRHLSPTSQDQVRQLLQHYPGAIIMVSHDRQFLDNFEGMTYQLTKHELRHQPDYQ